MKTGKPIIEKVEKIQKEDGENCWISVTKVPISDDRGQVMGIVGVSRDISIIKQIDTMIKAKEAALNEIDELGTPERRRKYALVYLSIYFVCYETEVEKRYVVFPPSNIGSMGIKTKLRGVFGAGKMKSFLQSRSQAIATLLDRLVDLTQENPVFEKEITEAGIEASILRTTELKVGIKKGLKELKDEG